LPLDWDELWGAIQAHKPAEPADLITAIKRKAEKLAPEMKAKTLGFLGQAGSDAVKLSKLNSWVNAKLAENGQEDE
jgi:hypothetical protein